MTAVETAVFEYNEDGPGAYTIMVNRLLVPNQIMRSAGWRDGQYMFLKVDGAITHATYKPEKMAMKLTAHDDDKLSELLFAIQHDEVNLDKIDGESIGDGGDIKVEELIDLD